MTEALIVKIVAAITAVFAVIYGIVCRRQVAKWLVSVVSSKVKLFVSGLLIVICTFVFNVARREINGRMDRVTDNLDGTMTVVRYGISGDSVVTANVSVPVRTYGHVLRTETEFEPIVVISDRFGLYRRKTVVISVLDDGRIVRDVPDDCSEITTGMRMTMTETFYPDYETKFKYLNK